MKFLKGFLVFLLIVIIVGGLGFIGYSFLFMNHPGHNTVNTTAENSQPANQMQDTSKNAAQNHAGMNQNSPSSQQTGNSAGLSQANIILQNKDSLNKSLTSLNDALKLLTVDPYALSSNSNGMGNMQMQGNAQASTPPAVQGNTQTNTTTTPAQGGNNTTINIYPQGGTNPSTQANTSQQSNMTMQNMGTVYDPAKMEQLHNGLYKISLGMSLLNQLQNQLVSQAENASANTQDLVRYYTNQYSQTAQNKTKLTQALSYINEATTLVNVNPYVSSNGLVYDKDRMNQIHQSVFKLAEGVASLNLLNDDFARQSIVLSNTVQDYINNANTNNMNMSSGLFGGLFQNISMTNVVNIVLIIFVIGLILGILGFIFSQIKPRRMASSKVELYDQPAKRNEVV
jgi:hypothetical protein